MVITTKRKRYKYVVYSSIIMDDEWSFTCKLKEFTVKIDAIEYFLDKCAEDVDKNQLDLDEMVNDGLVFHNLKINSYIWVKSEEI